MKHFKLEGDFGKALVILVSLVVFSPFLFIIENSDAGEADTLINQLQGRDPGVRGEAARKLGDLKDSRAVEPLVAILKKDKNREVRWSAEDALVNIGGPSVEPLMKMLKDDSWRARRRAVRTLGKIKDPRAIEPLVALMKTDDDCYVRKYAARAIGEINDPRINGILIPALKKKDWEVLEGAYRFYVRRGDPGSEAVLIETLNKYWNKMMVIDFLNSGNPQLREAAADCVKKRGYSTTSTVDWIVPKWGQAL